MRYKGKALKEGTRIHQLFEKYDTFEVWPVSEEIQDNGERVCTPLMGQDHSPCEVDFWTVYGHINGQGVEALADCPTKEAAEFIELCLNHTVKGSQP